MRVCGCVGAVVSVYYQRRDGFKAVGVCAAWLAFVLARKSRLSARDAVSAVGEPVTAKLSSRRLGRACFGRSDLICDRGQRTKCFTAQRENKGKKQSKEDAEHTVCTPRQWTFTWPAAAVVSVACDEEGRRDLRFASSACVRVCVCLTLRELNRGSAHSIAEATAPLPRLLHSIGPRIGSPRGKGGVRSRTELKQMEAGGTLARVCSLPSSPPRTFLNPKRGRCSHARLFV